MTTDQLEITFPDGSIKTVRQILDDKDNLQAQVSELKDRLKRSQELCGLLCDFIAAPIKEEWRI